MMLSDRTILAMMKANEIQVTPAVSDAQLQPVSLDLLLSTSFCRLPTNEYGQPHRLITNDMVIRPGDFLLASTIEHLVLPSHVAGVVHGKSTWARMGLMVEAAGLVDPGFDGTITLEMKNLSSRPIPLRAGVPICQISFHMTDVAVMRPYGTGGLNSHYQHQDRAEPARE